MPTMTIKQLADRIRTDLRTAQQAGRIPWKAGEYSEVRYDVRAIPAGPSVNVTIKHFAHLIPGYPEPTSEQVAAWRNGPGAALLAEVDRIRNAYNPDPPVYGGSVRFGPIFLGAAVTGSRIVGGGTA